MTETKSIPPYMDYDIKEDIEKNKPPKTQADVDKYLQEHSVKNGMNVIDIETCLEMDGLKLPENVVINSKGIGSIQFIQWYEKSQYPKTYEECCATLGYENREISFDTHTCKFDTLFENFYKLYICRYAYWKIAGEEMGLGKPWEPDWKDNSDKYFICYIKNELWMSNIRDCNRFLVFPTAEMRDTFYENFKELIQSCKEFL